MYISKENTLAPRSRPIAVHLGQVYVTGGSSYGYSETALGMYRLRHVQPARFSYGYSVSMVNK